MKAFLYLPDGTKFQGEAFGARREVMAELVFYTGFTGYPEVLTDPSYRGQTVLFTYPLIGNYGIQTDDFESRDVQVSAVVAREHCVHPSHYRSSATLGQFLQERNIPGISGFDTRMLTKMIRAAGAMPCLLTYDEQDPGRDLFSDYVFPDSAAQDAGTAEKQYFPGGGTKIGVLDLGCKRSIITVLQQLGASVYQYPYGTDKDEILADSLDALLYSNGPGNPKDCRGPIQLARDLMGLLPQWGICLGQQILALALGADTYKMKYGHRGGNHPVLNTLSQKVWISSQNHGYAVRAESLQQGSQITYINLHDHTVEGFDCFRHNIRAVQFHPEDGPGPQEGRQVVSDWLQSLKGARSHA